MCRDLEIEAEEEARLERTLKGCSLVFVAVVIIVLVAFLWKFVPI